MDSKKLKIVIRVTMVIQALFIIFCHNLIVKVSAFVLLTVIVCTCAIIVAHKNRDRSAMTKAIYFLALYLGMVNISLDKYEGHRLKFGCGAIKRKVVTF